MSANAQEDWRIEPINEKDAPWVIEFLRDNFYRDEPITDYVKLSDSPSAVAALSKFSTKNLGQNLSFAVRDSQGTLAGICINSVKNRNDQEDEETETDPIFGKITRLLGFAYEEAKVFEKFPDVDRVMYIDILSVNKSFGGKGLGTLMVNKTRELARQQGIKLLRVDCTSYFSARCSAKLGMECVYELKYEDHKENGVQVFNPGPPHLGLQVYVQRLDI